MGRALGFVGLLIALAIGGYLYTQQIKSVAPAGGSPKQAIDVTGVKNDLIAIANAELRYWATNARYASLEELRANGDIRQSMEGPYHYSLEYSENAFRLTATYTGDDPAAVKTLSIDESLQLTSE
jgi:hypothetical protein